MLLLLVYIRLCICCVCCESSVCVRVLCVVCVVGGMGFGAEIFDESMINIVRVCWMVIGFRV